MEYNRVSLKQAAKDAVRRAKPRFWQVSLPYLVITALIGGATSAVTTHWMQPLIDTVEEFGQYTVITQYGLMQYRLSQYQIDHLLQQVSATLSVVLLMGLLAALVTTVLSYGYSSYALKLWRGQSAGFGDVLSAFGMIPRVAATAIMVFLFSFLWGMLAMVIFFILTFLVVLAAGEAFLVLYQILVTAGLMAFLLWVILRYAMAPYWIITDKHCGGLEAITRSKRFMAGNKMRLVSLALSFLGWYVPIMLVTLVITYLGGQVGAGGLSAGFWSVLISVVSFVVSLPLSLWLTPYVNVSMMGFFDLLAGTASPPPSPGSGRYDQIPPVMSSGQEPPVQPPPAGNTYVQRPPDNNGLAGTNDPWNLNP